MRCWIPAASAAACSSRQRSANSSMTTPVDAAITAIGCGRCYVLRCGNARFSIRRPRHRPVRRRFETVLRSEIMLRKQTLEQFRVEPGTKVRLKDHDTSAMTAKALKGSDRDEIKERAK